MRYLFVSTPVGPLGSGKGGGVEINVLNLARQLQASNEHEVHIIAPEGSQLSDIPHTLVPGQPPIFAPSQQRTDPVTLDLPSALANLWDCARELAPDFDIVVNWAYDWLPFYLTPFFSRPIAHIVSMGSLSNNLDLAINQVRSQFPGTVAVHSQAQADTFAQMSDYPFQLLPCGIDLNQFQFVAEPDDYLSWVGRIAPEKGLEDCAALSQMLQRKVVVLGHMQDRGYWEGILAQYPGAMLEYRGFLPTAEMQAIVGRSQGLIVTPKWVEAFGMVVVEAMACGVPAIAYDRGGPAEIVVDGKTGWVVTPDSVAALAEAVGQLGRIERGDCRRHIEDNYSLEAMRERFCQWTANLPKKSV